MTDNIINGKPQNRRVLAPYPWPLASGGREETCDSSLFYLSWPGWEIYLAKRLGILPRPGGPRPLLLPDQKSPEMDFAAIDQLSRQAAELGAGLLGLSRSVPESVAGLASAISGCYLPKSPAPLGPVLDDRAYLALWAISEYKALESRDLLARAAAGEKAMWAALKGEDEEFSDEAEKKGSCSFDSCEPDRRAAYAWTCWKRLASPVLLETDQIIPAFPQ